MRLKKPVVSLESHHDWQISISNAWCRYDDHIVYVDEVFNYLKSSNVVVISGYTLTERENGSVHKVWIEPDNGGKLKADLFDFTPPPNGYFNYHDGVGYLIRLPKRQWRRGFTLDTFTSRWGGTSVGSSHKYAMSVFAHQHMSIPESYNAVGIERSREAAAFSDNYALIRKPALIPDTVFIAYKGDIIGVVDDDLVATLPVEVEFLQEELSQYLEVNIL